ncbi:MAG: glycoside hydrolase family 2, partial [Hymenobacter sp.]
MTYLMKQLVLLLGVLGTLTGGAQQASLVWPSAVNSTARTQLFDQDWRFLRDSVPGAEQPSYQDDTWRRLTLPHDWSIEDLPPQQAGTVAGPFARSSAGATSTGYAVGGTGWYRKTFTLPPATGAKRVSVRFDGVYRNADVWLNGHHLGFHPYGYTPFIYDLTPYHTGSGIYRHVWLTIAESIHVAPWGITVTTPQVSDSAAQVQVRTVVVNQGSIAAPVTVQVLLQTADGRVVNSTRKTATVAAAGRTDVTQTLTLAQPKRWSVETPYRYRAVVTIRQGSRTVDSLSTPFGVRTIHFNAQTGFTLNDKRIGLKGGCVHHDNGPLGAVALDRAEE